MELKLHPLAFPGGQGQAESSPHQPGLGLSTAVLKLSKGRSCWPTHTEAESFREFEERQVTRGTGPSTLGLPSVLPLFPDNLL